MAALLFLILLFLTLQAGTLPRVRSVQARSGLHERERIQISGQVSRIEKTESGVRILISGLSLPGVNGIGSMNAIAVLKDTEPDVIRAGDQIHLEGACKLTEPAANPGQFDYQVYEQARGILLHLTEACILSSQRRTGLMAAIGYAADRLGQALVSILGEEDAGVMKAMLLGQRQDIPDEIRSMYQAGGIAHILAVSGHPSTQTLMRLRRADSKVLRTDVDGAVTLGMEQDRIWVDTGR